MCVWLIKEINERIVNYTDVLVIFFLNISELVKTFFK